MTIAPYFTKSIAGLFLLGLFSEFILAEQKKRGSLREANEIICHRLNGKFEKKYYFLGSKKVKVDCITNIYAIEVTREVGYTNALYFALRGSYLTKKKPKIILYSKRGKKSNQFKRLKEVIIFYKLPIALEVMLPPLEFEKRKFKKKKQTHEKQISSFKKFKQEKKISGLKKRKKGEKEANKIYCDKIGGIQEVRYDFHNDKNAPKYAKFLKSDCETETYAIEMGYDNSNYKDNIFQALTYGYLSKKKAKIILYKRSKTNRNFQRTQALVKHYNLPIILEHLKDPLNN